MKTRLPVAAALSLAASLAMNLAIYFASVAAGWWDPAVEAQPGQPFNHVPVVLSSVASTAVAATVYGLLLRYTKRPDRIFYIVSAAVFAVYLIPPFAMGLPFGMAVALETMHVTTAASILFFLTVWCKQQPLVV